MITDSLIMKWRQEHGQNDSGWKWAQFDQTEATNVRLYAVRTLSDQAGKNFAYCGRNPYNGSEKRRTAAGTGK
mgnify:CR=1 FL=1